VQKESKESKSKERKREVKRKGKEEKGKQVDPDPDPNAKKSENVCIKTLTEVANEQFCAALVELVVQLIDLAEPAPAPHLIGKDDLIGKMKLLLPGYYSRVK